MGSNAKPAVLVELTLDAPSGDGASVGREPNGRVVFAEGGLPGESVVVELHTRKKRFAKGRVVRVVEGAPGRREPECPTGRSGCGGCDLAHADLLLQHEMKKRVVADSLSRIGRVDTVPSIDLVATPDRGYRTTVRAAVVEGLAGFRRRWSNEIVPASRCLVAHPAIEELLDVGRWGNASEIVVRASAAYGERLVVVDGEVDRVQAPDDVTVIARSELSAGRTASLSEHAGGREWRVSAESFFQAGPAAASALVDAVSTAADDVRGLTVVDAYSGIGLFAGTVGSNAARVIAIERSHSSVDDARYNLDPSSQIVEDAVETWIAEPADLVIADPARTGLGEGGVAALDATRAGRFVLVACDTGSLGRDVGLLQRRGFRLDSVTIVDAFPDTSHVETVVALSR